MKRKISLTTGKSAEYLYTNFGKQFKKALEQNSIGQMITSKQVLSVLNYMGFVDEEPSTQDIELSKTLTKMLSDSSQCLAVRRNNLFKFLIVLCDITQIKQPVNLSFFQDEASGLAMDAEDQPQPLIIIAFGQFDQFGRWSCSSLERQQIKIIFASMRAKRISRNQIEARKKISRQLQIKQTFQPKICPNSTKMAQQHLIKIKIDKNQKVQNRLLLMNNSITQKRKQKQNTKMQKQLSYCTFKPLTNNRCNSYKNRSTSKQHIHSRSYSQDRLQNLLEKGEEYKKKRQKLKQLQINLNQSSDLEACTFKPKTTKHKQTSKYVYVRNRDKEIQRLREGRKQRQYLNQVKQRGYPQGVSWSQFMSTKSTQQRQKIPVLCIDLKILNQQYNINVYDGENILSIAEKISRQHKVPQSMWWKVEQLIRKAIKQCINIKIQNNKIVATTK